MKYIGLVFSVVIIVALVGYGCSGNSTGPDDNFRDLILNLNNMEPNVGQKITIRVVSSDNVIQSEAIIDILEFANSTIRIPNIIDDSTDHLDIYADVNDNGAYDPPPVDDAWRIDIPASGTVDFSYNTTVTDIADPGPTAAGNYFTLKFQNFVNQVGRTMELRVIEGPDNRTVGTYRLDKIPSIVFTIRIPGIILDGGSYHIDFYVDMNVNNQYDPPPEDEAWSIGGGGTSSGLTITFAHNIDWKDIKF